MFIAEIKTFSPFGFKTTDSIEVLRDAAITWGDMVSVHTDPRWHGTWKDLQEVRKLTSKPILSKGMHHTDDDIQKALDLGADKVLVVGRVPATKYIPYCLLEPLYASQLPTYPLDATIVWNSRDLATGAPKNKKLWTLFRSQVTGPLIHASKIRLPSDVMPGADGFIVGEHLLTFIKASQVH